jgi:hypothetical protein
MEIEQLELDLWTALEKARQFPETMDVRPLAGISKSALCDALEHAILDKPLAEQLRVVAEGIEQLVGVYAERADYLIDGYERRHNPQEPIVDLEGCVELFVQSLQLDVSELMEPQEEVQYPGQRRSRRQEEETGSVVGVLDQAALLAQLDRRLSEEPGMTEAEAFNRATLAVSAEQRETAHDEDVSAWARAIGQGISAMGGEAMLLVELQRAIGMPLVQIWLALLLSGYDVEQRGGFYEAGTIWVKKL